MTTQTRDERSAGSATTRVKRIAIAAQCGGWGAGGHAPRVPRKPAGTRGTAGEQNRAGDGWQRRGPRTDQQAPILTKISGRVQEDPGVDVVVSA